MAKNTANYGNDSIRQLKDEERVRLRPAVIFGSDGLDGCAHAAFEILSNAVDEARQGYGKLITLTAFRDGSIQVEDNGRGCPLDWNPSEKRFNWELVFCELYAGGKYNNNQGGDYDFSLGTNGLGSCATQYASEYMDVTVWRDGNKYSLHFKKGKVVGAKKKALEIEPSDENRTGTTIKWRPDLEVFTSISIPHDWYRETMRRQAVVNANVTFRLRIEGGDGEFTEEDFCYPKGIEDYVLEKVGTDYLTEPFFIEADRRGRDREDLPDYNVKITACMCFSRTFMMQEYYHNSSWLENGGSPEKAARSALTSAIDAYIKQQGKYNKNESGIKWQDVQDCLVLVSSNFSTQTSYENQTKKAITNKFVQDAMSEFLREQLQVYFIENREAAERIANQVLVNKRSRETAERTRLNTRKKLTEKIDIANRVQKFVDCRTKDVSRREIYIVEGDSALGACKQSRDAEFQGLMPVRGKILNCLKADYPRIFKSDVITDLMKVLGCGVEVQGKAAKELNQFDLNNLRWSKVVICTDGDVDGFQIRTLILTMLYRLCPTLIKEGYVYIAETPLFEITCKEKTWFAYSEKEKAEVVRQLEGKKYKVDRSKGLGENDPEMMWLTTMNPETRRLVKVLPDDAEETARVFDLLLGDNLSAKMTEFYDKFNLFGINLGEVPSWHPDVWNATAIGLFLIPVLSGVLQLALTIYMQIYQKKKNPGMPNMGCMNIMLYAMPIFSVWFAFQVPAGVGFYWVCSSFFSLIQSVGLNCYFTKERIEAICEKENQKNAKKYANGKKSFMQRMMDVQQGNDVMNQREKYAEETKDMSRSELNNYNQQVLKDARKRMAEKYGETYDESDSTEDSGDQK